MQQTERRPLFDLGQLVATPGALAALEKSGQSPMDFLVRHVTGDWGELCEEDRKENQFSLEKGFRLLSSYKTNAGDRLWIITTSIPLVFSLLRKFHSIASANQKPIRDISSMKQRWPSRPPTSA